MSFMGRLLIGNVLGPHFELVCRHWTRHMAPPELFGDHPNEVGSGTVDDASNRIAHEVDILAFGLDDGRRPLLALGEAKWGELMNVSHVDRWRRIRDLLTAQGRHGAATAKLACYSGAGFTDELTETARRDSSMVLVSAADLYRRE